jgi:nitrate reductase gamma subunit
VETTESSKKLWFKGFGHYVLWFVVWGSLLALLQPVTTGQMAGTTFWAIKVQQALLGAGFGVACAIAFVLLQNGLNATRRKWLSWALAISTWLAVGVLLAYATGRFGELLNDN